MIAHRSTHTSLGAHMSAHTSAHTSLGAHTSAHMSAHTSFWAHTSAHTSFGAHTSAHMCAFLPQDPICSYALTSPRKKSSPLLSLRKTKMKTKNYNVNSLRMGGILG